MAMSKRRKWAVGGGVGAVVVAVAAIALLPLLAIFKLQHLFKNIESKRFGNMEYAYNQRSDAWNRAYLKARLQVGSDADEAAYFRAKHIDTNSPFHDWFHTLRVNGFEKDLAAHQGIIFRSDPTTGRVVQLNVAGKQYGDIAKNIKMSDANVETIFNTDKEARAAIRTAVKDETYWFQIIKRRHVRTWMQNVLGVRKWKIFEGTRTNVAQAIRARYSQFILAPISAHISDWVNCVVAKASSCPKKTDLNSSDNSATRTQFSSETSQNGSQKGQDPKQTTQFNNTANTNKDGVAGDIQTQTQNAIDELGNPDSKIAADAEAALAKDATSAAGKTLSAEEKQFVPSNLMEAILSGFLEKDLAGQVVGKVAGPQAIIGVLDLANQADIAISNNVVGKIVAVRNSLQYAAAFTAFAITVDHLKAGQNVSGEEVNAVMQKFNGVENSQGYDDVINNGKKSGGTGYAAVTGDKQVNNSHIENVSKGYNSTIGLVAHPLLATYNAIRNAPIIGTVINIFNSLVSSIVGPILKLIINTVKFISGGVIDINKFLGKFLIKLFDFAFGAVVDGSETGGAAFNAIDAGADVTANSYTKSAGGHRLSPTALIDINKQIAADQKLEAKRQSAWTRLASLDNADSLVSRLALNLPGTWQEAVGGIGHWLADAITSPFRAVMGQSTHLAMAAVNPGYAAGDDIYGVKQFGFSSSDKLDQDPTTMTTADCKAQIAAWQTAQKSDIEDTSDQARSLCLFDQTFAEASKSVYTTVDDGGLGNGQTPTAGPPSGDSQSLAKQIIASPQFDWTTDPQAKDAKAAIQAVADGGLATNDPSCPHPGAPDKTTLDSKLLAALLGISQNHKIEVGWITNGCHQNVEVPSRHYVGKAADINRVDGKRADNSNQADWNFDNDLEAFLPAGSRFGQAQCGVSGHVSTGGGKFSFFDDACSHIHVDVP